MGTRGALPGKGGRPSAVDSGKPRLGKAACRAAMLDSLSGITFDRLREHCESWRQLDASDEVALLTFWSILARYNVFQELLDAIPSDEWDSEEARRLFFQLRAHAEQIMQWVKLFGMSPADRARMGEAPPKGVGQTPFEAMVANAAKLTN